MNNTQFRRLVLDTPTASRSKDEAFGSISQRGGATPALGSRMRSSIPMTPRSVAGTSNNDFARQLAERNADLNPSHTKKFRSSVAPKGTKLGAGYQDRTQLRTSGEEDEKAIRVKALENMVKLGQMDQATFEALRDEIVGGDVKDVHLVKGLDYKLLERVRRGEDVLSDRSQPRQQENENESVASKADVEGEFEELEKKEVQPVEKEERAKKGQMAPSPAAGKKRTRDDILQELKASRLAAAEKAKQSVLGPKFMKVGQKRETSRIERDERGCEVLITVDEDGRVKRKVKKVNNGGAANGQGMLMPDKDAKPLGMEVAPIVPSPAEEDDGDIFQGVGTDYNPLGDIADENDDDDDTDVSVDNVEEPKAPPKAEPPTASSPPKPSRTDSPSMAPPPIPSRKRKWLGDPEASQDAADTPPSNPLTDPTILAALKKASTIAPIAQASSNEEEAAKLARRKKMLEAHDRDAEDMDMEFGSSRFGDQEDGEEGRVKLSIWGGEEGEEDGKGKKGPRKRGAKKRKGDANSAADVMRVVERRREEGK